MILISFKGAVDMDIVVKYLSEIRKWRIENNLSKKITKIYVELLQNIQFYSHKKDNNGKGIGEFIIKKENSSYLLEFQNIVNKDQKSFLESHIDYLNSLEKEERTDYKMKLLRSSNTNNSSGSIGLLKVVGESSEKPLAQFKKLDDNSYIYVIKSKISANE